MWGRKRCVWIGKISKIKTCVLQLLRDTSERTVNIKRSFSKTLAPLWMDWVRILAWTEVSNMNLPSCNWFTPSTPLPPPPIKNNGARLLVVLHPLSWSDGLNLPSAHQEESEQAIMGSTNRWHVERQPEEPPCSWGQCWAPITGHQHRGRGTPRVCRRGAPSFSTSSTSCFFPTNKSLWLSYLDDNSQHKASIVRLIVAVLTSAAFLDLLLSHFTQAENTNI